MSLKWTSLGSSFGVKRGFPDYKEPTKMTEERQKQSLMTGYLDRRLSDPPPLVLIKWNWVPVQILCYSSSVITRLYSSFRLLVWSYLNGLQMLWWILSCWTSNSFGVNNYFQSLSFMVHSTVKIMFAFPKIYCYSGRCRPLKRALSCKISNI